MLEFLKNKIEFIKTLLAVSKDLILLIVFCILIFFPKKVNTILSDAGFNKGNIMGFEWQKRAAEQTKASLAAAGKANEQVQLQIDGLATIIDSIERKVNDPVLKQKFREISEQIKASQDKIATADKSVKDSYDKQYKIVDNINSNSNNSTDNSGWFYIGKVNKQKDDWYLGYTKNTIDRISLKKLLEGNQTVKIIDEVFLRSGKMDEKNFYSNLPIKKIIKVDEKVVVRNVGFTPAIGGGYFIWGYVAD
jgi:hypothetical protein